MSPAADPESAAALDATLDADPDAPLPIIAVDDEEHILVSFQTALELGGHEEVVALAGGERLLETLDRRGAAVVLLDLNMPPPTGTELLPRIQQEHPGVPVVVVTGNSDVDTAVRCMKAGAFDYLVKPVDQERLLATVHHAIAFGDLARENLRLRRAVLAGKLQKPEAFMEIVTADERMLAVMRYAEAIASSTRPVLITGETGVGKELMARAIHRASHRKGPFVAMNAGGLDDTLFSDTLFGHRAGAYTSADRDRRGLIETAAGGSLFLDEIGDLSAPSQVKLLRLLQEREYFPLGEDTPRRSDARVIVATNHDLEAAQRAGAFRKDLYYRLHTHHVHVPPLRERKGDIPLLLDHLLGVVALEFGKKKPTPPKELATLLSCHDFPGNVRELEAMVTDAVSLHDGMMLSMDAFRGRVNLEAGARPESQGEAAEPVRFGERLPSMDDVRDRLIDEALQRTKGNKSLAAQILGVTRQTINRRLKARTDDPESASTEA